MERSIIPGSIPVAAKYCMADDYERAIGILETCFAHPDASIAKRFRQTAAAVLAFLGPEHHLSKEYGLLVAV